MSADPKFKLLSEVDLAQRPDPTWLVHDLLVARSFAVLYGASGSGKTFVALDWALSVASGLPWRGRAVRRGPVVYVTAEGGANLKHRVAAWRHARRYDRPQLSGWFVLASVNLMDEDETAALTRAIRLKLGARRPVLVVFDTLNTMMPDGDENTPRDMGAVLASVRRIRRRTGAAVLLLHHTGWTAERERGHSSLRGAADTMIGLSGDPEEPTAAHELVCKKQRDASPFEPIRLGLVPLDQSLVVGDAPKSGSGGPWTR